MTISKRLVSIGECMIEMSPKRSGDFSMSFAGDTFNTAWYLRKLLPEDWQVDYLTCTGQDVISTRMIAFMQDAGIGTEYIKQHADKTVGLYMIELDEGERSFVYWREASAARTLADDTDLLARAFKNAGCIFLSGISLAILSSDARTRLFTELDIARNNGSIIVFDPNLRPRLWPDNKTMCAEIEQAASHADIVLPSHDEEALYFNDADPTATAKRYHDQGVTTVIVKNGVDRLIVSRSGHEKELSFLPEPASKIVDTTAAGDSFNAGVLSKLLNNADIGDAVTRGMRVAAKVVGSHGALVPDILTTE